MPTAYVVTYVEHNDGLAVAQVDLVTSSKDDAIDHANNEFERTGMTHFVFAADDGGSVAGARCVWEVSRE